MNVQPGVWLPVAVYVEETQRSEADKAVGLKAQRTSGATRSSCPRETART